jgi:hypothetical protein
MTLVRVRAAMRVLGSRVLGGAGDREINFLVAAIVRMTQALMMKPLMAPPTKDVQNGQASSDLASHCLHDVGRKIGD